MRSFNKQIEGESPFQAPESLSRTIFQYLEKEIIEGRLEAGFRLVPEEIAKRLDVSKSPVREALQALQKEGFVTNKAALKAIVENEYESDFIPTLEELLQEMEQRAQEDNVKGYFYLNVKLYNFLLERCPNRRVSKMLSQLGKQVLRFRFMSMSNPGHIRRSLDGHKRLIKALKEKDVEASMRIAEGVIYAALDVLQQILGGKNLAKNKEDYV